MSEATRSFISAAIWPLRNGRPCPCWTQIAPKTSPKLWLMELGDGLKLLTRNLVLASEAIRQKPAQPVRRIEFFETKADAKVRLFYLFALSPARHPFWLIGRIVCLRLLVEQQTAGGFERTGSRSAAGCRCRPARARGSRDGRGRARLL